MQRIPWTLVILLSAWATARVSGEAEHVVVVVWDGLRPDFVRPQYTPALYEFASRGTFFKNHHSAYITSTEVNGTALATGMQPDHSGIIANTEYRPDLNWLASYGSETLDAVRRGDLLSGGHYLESATVAELIQAAGYPTVIAGAKPVALLHDRSPKKVTKAQKDSVTLFRGQTLPRSVQEAFAKAPDIGPMPTNLLGTNAFAAATGSSATNAPGFPPSRRGGAEGGNPSDAWTTKALIRGLWKKGVPKYTLLWLSEPDAAQHEHGVGSEQAIAALEGSDTNFASVLKALEDKGVLEQTDVLVVSDHGFSTINHGPDLLQSLKRAKFTAGKQFQNPESGDILVINLGGSIAFYVFEHDETVTRRLVAFLQSSDFAGVIFAALDIEGTFPLAQGHLATSISAPDVMVSMRWSDEHNEHGFPGMVSSFEGKSGQGTHASLSRFDLHNTLVAAGPDFKQGFVNELPSGNIDVAPTVLFLLGIKPSTPMDGRVLSEALLVPCPAQPKPVEKTGEASRTTDLFRWHQFLKTSQVGYSVYYDEGNGESQFR